MLGMIPHRCGSKRISALRRTVQSTYSHRASRPAHSSRRCLASMGGTMSKREDNQPLLPRQSPQTASFNRLNEWWECMKQEFQHNTTDLTISFFWYFRGSFLKCYQGNTCAQIIMIISRTQSWVVACLPSSHPLLIYHFPLITSENCQRDSGALGHWLPPKNEWQSETRWTKKGRGRRRKHVHTIGHAV